MSPLLRTVRHPRGGTPHDSQTVRLTPAEVANRHPCPTCAGDGFEYTPGLVDAVRKKLAAFLDQGLSAQFLLLPLGWLHNGQPQPEWYFLTMLIEPEVRTLSWFAARPGLGARTDVGRRPSGMT